MEIVLILWSFFSILVLMITSIIGGAVLIGNNFDMPYWIAAFIFAIIFWGGQIIFVVSTIYSEEKKYSSSNDTKK